MSNVIHNDTGEKKTHEPKNEIFLRNWFIGMLVLSFGNVMVPSVSSGWNCSKITGSPLVGPRGAAWREREARTCIS